MPTCSECGGFINELQPQSCPNCGDDDPLDKRPAIEPSNYVVTPVNSNPCDDVGYLICFLILLSPGILLLFATILYIPYLFKPGVDSSTQGAAIVGTIMMSLIILTVCGCSFYCLRKERKRTINRNKETSQLLPV